MTRKVYLNFRLVQHYEYLAKIIPYCEEIIPKIIPPHLVIINPIVPVLCSIGDWFVLYQMSRNMNRYNTILKICIFFGREISPHFGTGYQRSFPGFTNFPNFSWAVSTSSFFIVIATRFVPFYLNKNSYNLDKENKK